jgi:hypothetical protein
MWSCDTCYLLGLVQTPAHRPDVGPVTVFGWPWSTGAGWFLVHVSGPSGARPFRADQANGLRRLDIVEPSVPCRTPPLSRAPKGRVRPAKAKNRKGFLEKL